MHSHTVDGQPAERIHALESTLYGLVDMLVGKRVVGEAEVAASARRVAQTIEGREQRAHGVVVLRVDPPDEQTFPP
ncbi:MAG: hypothetical protein LC795_20075 [Acidobacteria bacterium]|nr:hypothetical protein [Acidobacteriota bacterium]MCA1621524.1 hypothetical protein [Acidobacteriota bacterium]